MFENGQTKTTQAVREGGETQLTEFPSLAATWGGLLVWRTDWTIPNHNEQIACESRDEKYEIKLITGNGNNG